MLDFGFDGIDTGDIKIPLLADRLDRLGRDDPEFGHLLAGKCFDFKPDSEAILRLPDLCHFFPCITFDHR